MSMCDKKRGSEAKVKPLVLRKKKKKKEKVKETKTE